MNEQKLYAVALSAADPSEPDNYWIEFYWADDDEHAEEQAKDANPAACVLCTPATTPQYVTTPAVSTAPGDRT